MNSGRDLWLSLCVPTYNRAALLENLYKSIISQDPSNIELIIVNDGSRDRTETLVQDWIAESKVRIQYYYQNNAGRGSALRKALLNAEDEYTIIMDDDDYFVNGALETIKQSLLRIKNQSVSQASLAGICCLCLGEDGEIIGNRFPDEDYISDFFKMRFFENISGDKKEIVKTEILKKNIFPNFENEKRVVTSTLWNRIAYDYDCLCLNYPVSVKRYIKGGMSDTLLALKAESPNYQIEDCITTINFPNQFSLRITLIYSTTLWKYWFFGGNLSLSRIKLSRLPFVFFGLPLGLILYLKDELKLRSLKSYDR